VSAVHDLAGGRETGYWVSIEAVAKSIDVPHERVIAAIRSAEAANLLRASGGRAPRSVRLTHMGLLLVEGRDVEQPTTSGGVPSLVRQFIKATHEITRHKPPPSWIAIHRVVLKLCIRDGEKIHDVIAYAVLSNLIRVDAPGDPHSVMLTADGVKLASRP